MKRNNLRYTMIGFILGVLVTILLQELSFGTRAAAPFYGAGIGLLVDNMITKWRSKKGP
ncbi:hypothetical protein [Ammoniphilus sp. CFH 90114]|uniref:hypothetical protein n=1 Tax=Ammoniphilus sp. CFH 90114 TaxID=2493665 RepID=UPI0013E96484|nr:hypothetical protein [Ammoniphilus sp. CFH 90114]